MDGLKKVSVIIPCHNAEAYVDRCLASLASQSIGIENIEIIAVDDASSDGTAERLMEWEKSLPESVCVVSLDENVKQGAARNIGLTYAGGEYVSYVDADDWMAERALEIAVKSAEEYRADIVGYLPLILSDISEDTGQTDSGLEDEFLNIRDISDRIRLLFDGKTRRGCWDKLYRRDFVTKNHLRYAEGVFDEESLFTIPALMNADRYVLVNKYLYRYFDNRDGTCSSSLLKREHIHDNEITWLLVYEALAADGSLQREPEVVEALFVLNYFNRSLLYNYARGLRYDSESIGRLQSNLKALFPAFLENPIVRCMRSFGYIEALSRAKVTDGNIGGFYSIVDEWQKTVGNEL